MQHRTTRFTALCSLTALLAACAAEPAGEQDTSDLETTSDAVSALPTVVLYAADATVRAGDWSVVSDSTAAGGARMSQPDRGAPKVESPAASPANYFELTFQATAGTPYRLWVRGRAQNDQWANDSAWVQFDGSVDATGAPAYRIGTTSGTWVSLEECSGCGEHGWGWQDNGWGAGALGPAVYFQTTGTQRVRVQTREDGFSIDQIVLSPNAYYTSAPGSQRDDDTILPRASSSLDRPPTVSATASPATGTAPLDVRFTTSASDPDGTVVSYRWSFGDGQTSSTASPTHTYAAAGTYRATVTVTDDAGLTASTSLTVSASASAAPAPTDHELRVVEYNIAKGKGTDAVVNLARQADEIVKTDPDVVCLVEPMGGNGQVDTYRGLLQTRTGTTWYSSFAPKYPGCAEGVAVLSRHPIVSSETHYFPHDSRTLSDSRFSVGRATLNVNGRTVHAFCAHIYINWNGGTDPYQSQVQQTQMNDLVQYASGFAGPRVIAGDFNTGPSGVGPMTAAYHEAWADAVAAHTASAYADNPVGYNTRTRRSHIDYVFYNTGAGLTVLDAAIPDTRDLTHAPSILLGTLDDRGVRPSDHNKLAVTFQF